jgi:hypothetical protein
MANEVFDICLHCTVIRLANKQLSGPQKVKIDLVDYLFKPSSYSHRFSSYPIRLDTHLEVTD